MGFIERLRLEKEVEVLIKQHLEKQLEQQREAAEKARLQAENMEKERHAQRRKQAERLREESGIEIAVAQLRDVLGAIPYNYSLPDRVQLTPKDSDSVFLSISWENRIERTSFKEGKGTYTYHSGKYIAIETCPEGAIVFHAGRFGSTTIQQSQWRSNEKDQLFDKALEKAYRNPGINKYSTFHKHRITSLDLGGFG